MPTLPRTTVSSLKKATPGSLVSLRDGAGKLVFGIRVSTTDEPEDPQEPALVVLTPVEGGIVASLVPNRGDMERFAELEIVRLDRIERRARNSFERAARHGNAHLMLRAARLQMAAHAKAMTIFAAAARPFNSLT
jgi:hypothetical protein